MRIATWNVNGIRPRLEQIKQVLTQWDIDILCMQETKIDDSIFPHQDFEDLGYQHRMIVGQKAYHGVAIVSRLPFAQQFRQVFAGVDDKRHAAVKVAGLELHCFYCPAGGDVPDRDKNPKFDHKMRFYADAKQWFLDNRSAQDPLLLLGDFNIAPHENDVWNHRKLSKSVGHSPLEVETYLDFQNALQFQDLPRKALSFDDKLFSWWGYRYPQSVQKDYGWRLDHAWATPLLDERIKATAHVKDTRLWEKPSDHIPILIDLD